MKKQIQDICWEEICLAVKLDEREDADQEKGILILWNEKKQEVISSQKERNRYVFEKNILKKYLGKYEFYWEEDGQKIPVECPEQIFSKIRLENFSYYNENINRYLYFSKIDEKLMLSIEKSILSSNIIVLPVEKTEIREGGIRFVVQDKVFNNKLKYHFSCIAGSDVGRSEFPLDVLDESTVEVDLSDFITMVRALEKNSAKWRCYFTVIDHGEYRAYRCKDEKIAAKIKKNKPDFYDQRFKFLEPVVRGMKEERMLVPYYTNKGYFGMINTSEEGLFHQGVMNKMTALQLSGTSIYMKWECVDTGMEITEIVFQLRTRHLGEEGTFSLPIHIIKKEKNKITIECRGELPVEQLKPMYWDCSVVYEGDGKRYLIGATNVDKAFEKKNLEDFWAKNTIKLDNHIIFYPYMTVKGRLAFQCREEEKYDTLGFRIKERVAAALYWLLKKRLSKKNIYLVFEKYCEMAQDNGYYFFKYCMENHVEEEMGKEIYYVMDKNSPDYAKVKEYGNNVIPFMSVKHMVYLLASKLLISTDLRAHGYAWRCRGSILKRYLDSKKMVFLQHGVIALKRIDFVYAAGKWGQCDLFITSNDQEKDIIYNYFGYKRKQIAVTGLCRWDVLEDKSENSREILVVPTWRSWLEDVDDDVFMESDYYKNYMKLLNSKELEEMLEKYDVKLNFYLHTKFKEYMSDFHISGNRIRLIPFGEEPLNELMMKCKLLITDYSSVCWDVFYQGKPVIFYQFDTEQYLISHGSYIDFDTDLFGDRTKEIPELLELLEEYICTDFKLKDQYAVMRESCYKYIDNDNSRRICEEIKKRKW